MMSFQQIAYFKEAPLHEVFIDLDKAYDAMDQSHRCLKILEGFRVCPNLLRLLSCFWDVAEMACKTKW